MYITKGCTFCVLFFLILVRNTFYVICVYLALSDCKEVLDKFPEAKSGQYEIKLWTSGKILTVNCDMKTEGGGWTVCRFFYSNV
jgi:hypothetical protein